jgi:hypothetical protein
VFVAAHEGLSCHYQHVVRRDDCVERRKSTRLTNTTNSLMQPSTMPAMLGRVMALLVGLARRASRLSAEWLIIAGHARRLAPARLGASQ